MNNATSICVLYLSISLTMRLTASKNVTVTPVE